MSFSISLFFAAPSSASLSFPPPKHILNKDAVVSRGAKGYLMEFAKLSARGVEKGVRDGR